MEYAVRYQHEQYAGKLRPGDHICTNHPLAGGTHLPDITIVTPVWDAEGKDIIFYVASRGHHGKFDIYSHDEDHVSDVEQPKSEVSNQALCLPTVDFSMKRVP
jgi:hypothetical protein